MRNKLDKEKDSIALSIEDSLWIPMWNIIHHNEEAYTAIPLVRHSVDNTVSISIKDNVLNYLEEVNND